MNGGAGLDAARQTLARRTYEYIGFPLPAGTSSAAFERWLADAIPAVDAALQDAAREPHSAELAALIELWTTLTHLRFKGRIAQFTSVQTALAQLRTTTDLATVFDRGVRMICDVCGFDRAIIFRVDGSRMFVERAHFPKQPEIEKEFLELARAEPPTLNHLLLETEMIRRGGPVLVVDAANDPRTHKRLTSAGLTRSYVAAPILPAGKVIGFIHADRYDSGRDVDEFDRDALFAFAEGFGYAIERTILMERLRAQSREVLQMMRRTEAAIDGFADAELDLCLTAAARTIGPTSTASGSVLPAGPATRLDDLLTRRELEVLRLMAKGRTNAGIAEELVISSATVKSHVQHVLRKLRASNRAEAVSKYMRIQDAGDRV
jgi:LuxR family transcriptional regulator, regulator of acetate metabolism